MFITDLNTNKTFLEYILAIEHVHVLLSQWFYCWIVLLQKHPKKERGSIHVNKLRMELLKEATK